jgi:hypothetical protein
MSRLKDMRQQKTRADQTSAQLQGELDTINHVAKLIVTVGVSGVLETVLTIVEDLGEEDGHLTSQVYRHVLQELQRALPPDVISDIRNQESARDNARVNKLLDDPVRATR